MSMSNSRHEQHSERTACFYNVRLSASDAWTGTTIAVLFNALGMLLEMGIIQKTSGVSTGPAAISVAVALVLLAALLMMRKNPSLRATWVIFALNTISVATVLLFTNSAFAASDRNWSPFQASKLGCLVAAMIAPEFWVGFMSIMAYCLSSVVQYLFLSG